jgi:hypothetical protein
MIESIVTVLLLAGVGIVFFIVFFAIIARAKKKNINTTPVEKQRAESFSKGASGKDD